MNFESSQSSMVLSTESNRSNNNQEIFSTNKTDSEKFNEIQCKDVLVPIETSAPTVLTDREVNNSTVKNARNSEIFCESASGEIDVHDIQNILLRRQQLTRVAEWVQNSSNIPLPNSPMQKLESFQVQKNLEFGAAAHQTFQENTENNAQNSNKKVIGSEFYVESENLSIKSGQSDEDDKLAQMEYNVKKFLLGTKLQEMNGSLFSDSYASKSECNDDIVINKKPLEGGIYVQRTETNL